MVAFEGMCSPVRVSVVGTAGRSQDGKKMTSALFKRMIDKTVDVITNKFKLDMGRIRLVSGGAAWSGERNSRIPVMQTETVLQHWSVGCCIV